MIRGAESSARELNQEAGDLNVGLGNKGLPEEGHLKQRRARGFRLAAGISPGISSLMLRWLRLTLSPTPLKGRGSLRERATARTALGVVVLLLGALFAIGDGSALLPAARAGAVATPPPIDIDTGEKSSPSPTPSPTQSPTDDPDTQEPPEEQPGAGSDPKPGDPGSASGGGAGAPGEEDATREDGANRGNGSRTRGGRGGGERGGRGGRDVGFYRPGGAYSTDRLIAIALELRALGWETDKIARRVYAPFIIAGPAAWTNTWGAPRYGPAPGQLREHQGQDVFCEYGSPVIASERGVVEFGEGGLGGMVARLHGADGGYWYYAHLSDWNLDEFSSGDQVEVGDTIGFCGNSGNAATTPSHVHFGWYRADGRASDPFRSLVRWLHQAERRAGVLADAAHRSRVRHIDGLTMARRFGDGFMPQLVALDATQRRLVAQASLSWLLPGFPLGDTPGDDAAGTTIDHVDPIGLGLQGGDVISEDDFAVSWSHEMGSEGSHDAGIARLGVGRAQAGQ